MTSYPQHTNTIQFTIQWAGCPKGSSCLRIVTAAKMAMLRQDLFLKNKIIKQTLPPKKPNNNKKGAHRPRRLQAITALPASPCGCVKAPAQWPAATPSISLN